MPALRPPKCVPVLRQCVFSWTTHHAFRTGRSPCVDASRERARAHVCADRTYIFNGDFVDRGKRGVEVMMMILALKVPGPSLCPLPWPCGHIPPELASQ